MERAGVNGYSVEVSAERGRAAAAARLILLTGMLVTILDGLTTFTGLHERNIGEANVVQALAIQRYGLGGAIALRVVVGTTVFAFLAWLFGRWTGWGRHLLFLTAVAGIATTTTFVANNLSVLYLQHTLLPSAYLHGVYAAAVHLSGITP